MKQYDIIIVGSAAGGLNLTYDHSSDEFKFRIWQIQILDKSDKTQICADSPAEGFAFEMMDKHSFDFWLLSKHFSNPKNRINLANKKISYTRSNLIRLHLLRDKLKNSLDRSGSFSHFRFTTNYFAKAINIFCRFHDIKNLFIEGRYFFVSSFTVNPAMTNRTIVHRVGYYINKELLN